MPVEVVKGVIDDPTSPYLLHNEGVTVNEIKNPNEILLKDNSGCSWLALYLQKGILQDGSTTVTVAPQNDITEATVLSVPIESWKFYDYTTNDFKAIQNIEFYTTYKFMNNMQSTNAAYVIKNKTGEISDNIPWESYKGLAYAINSNLNWLGTQAQLKAACDPIYSAALKNMTTAVYNVYSYPSISDIAELNGYIGKIVKDSNNKYWRIKKSEDRIVKEHKDVTYNYQTSLYTLMQQAWNSSTNQSVTPNDQAFDILAQVNAFRLIIEPVEETSITFNLGAATAHTDDSPLFDCICMPYADVEGYLLPGYVKFTNTKDRAMRIMNSIATQLGAEKVIDLQLLPYCPCNANTNPYFNIATPYIEGVQPFTVYVGDTSLQHDYSDLIGIEGTDGTYTTDFIFIARSANVTFDIQQQVTANNYNYANIDDVCQQIKYINDCTKLRLCSPNYNGLFEMNLAKNDMSIDWFNVDMTLRPFTPYIHVNPNFKKLYGQDTNDQRGLLCGGDFSLGILKDA